ANLHTDQERDYFMQRYHDVISSFGGKTSYDADNRPLLVMRSNLWASGYDVDGTDQTSLGQFSDRKSGSAGMPRPISYAVFCLKKKTTVRPEWRAARAAETPGAAAGRCRCHTPRGRSRRRVPGP